MLCKLTNILWEKQPILIRGGLEKWLEFEHNGFITLVKVHISLIKEPK